MIQGNGLNSADSAVNQKPTAADVATEPDHQALDCPEQRVGHLCPKETLKRHDEGAAPPGLTTLFTLPVLASPPRIASHEAVGTTVVIPAGGALETGELIQAKTKERELSVVEKLFVATATHTQFASYRFPPKDWIMDGLLHTRQLAMIAAYRGVGKTWCSLSLAASIASGYDWLRWSTPAPRKVLYIDGEMAAAEIQERLFDLCGDYVTDNLMILASEAVESMLEAGLNIASKECQECLQEYLLMLEHHGMRPDVIILDNLMSLSSGVDENDNTAQGSINVFLRKLRHAGYCVVLIHHAGYNGKQRGASSREDFLNLSILLEPTPGNPVKQPMEFKVTATKARSTYTGLTSSFGVSLADIGNGVLELYEMSDPDDISAFDNIDITKWELEQELINQGRDPMEAYEVKETPEAPTRGRLGLDNDEYGRRLRLVIDALVDAGQCGYRINTWLKQAQKRLKPLSERRVRAVIDDLIKEKPPQLMMDDELSTYTWIG